MGERGFGVTAPTTLAAIQFLEVPPASVAHSNDKSGCWQNYQTELNPAGRRATLQPLLAY